MSVLGPLNENSSDYNLIKPSSFPTKKENNKIIRRICIELLKTLGSQSTPALVHNTLHTDQCAAFAVMTFALTAIKANTEPESRKIISTCVDLCYTNHRH